MLRLRTSSLAVALAALLASCTKSQPALAVAGRTSQATGPLVASFVGQFDGATGKLTITPIPSDDPNALSVFIPYADGVPGSTPNNTFELMTTAYGTDPNGCGPGIQSYYGDIQITSGFQNQTFGNVWAEITDITTGTSNAGCNSDSPGTTGLSGVNGLWSYGSISYGGQVSKRWNLRYQSGDNFTFHGRIVADLGAPTTSALAFDWAPTYIVSPTRTFQEVGTTTHHLVWNGSGFTDTKTSMTFATQGSALSGSSALTDPASTYAEFSNGSYYVENLSGSSLVDTSGDFTVCAKFKPGTHPGLTNPTKVLVSKGFPEATDTRQGWALMQMHTSYCFHFRTSKDTNVNTMSFYPPGGYQSSVEVATQPETWEYDYVCGGYTFVDPTISATNVMVGVHGTWRGYNPDYAIRGNITNDASLPLVIGAYGDGTSSASDAGVYEVIFDSRAASLDVMNEIVSAAEARTLPGASPGIATYLAPFANGTQVLGGDPELATTFVLAPFATVPLPADGTGLLPLNTTVSYSRPFTTDTTVSGYCVGVELVALDAWYDTTNNVSLVNGTLLQVPGGHLQFSATWGFELDGGSIGFDADNFTTEKTSYFQPKTAHRFTGCVDPDSPTGQIKLYIDGTQVGNVTFAAGTHPLNVGATTSSLAIQGAITGGTSVPLTGARIRRAFACPTNNEALCR